jgi:predicted ATP-dependent endonuclease of OLD family
MARVLGQLAKGTIPGVAERTQVIYSTHSPLMVGLDRFDQIRCVRRDVLKGQNDRFATLVTSASADAVATEIWRGDGAVGDCFTGASLMPRLTSIMTPWMNEGFFADLAVLVEGESDRAAILAEAARLGVDLDALGVSVIPCFSKNSIDRPLAIFRHLGIPVFPVWDCDRGKGGAKPAANLRLLRLLGKEPVAWPATRVEEGFACFEQTLEDTLKLELSSAVYEEAMQEAQDRWDLHRDDAQKQPAVMRDALERSADRGYVSNSLSAIILAISSTRQ